MKLRHRLFAGATAALFATAPVVAQTTVNGPYYATPSWDQTLPAASRFVVLANFANAAVLDRETGLVWERALSTTGVPATNAIGFCANSTTGGRMGWHLPTISELTSLFDPAVKTTPALPAGHPFTGFPTGTLLEIWSSTPDPYLSRNGNAFYFDLLQTRSLLAVSSEPDAAQKPFLCVRGPGMNDH